MGGWLAFIPWLVETSLFGMATFRLAIHAGCLWPDSTVPTFDGGD